MHDVLEGVAKFGMIAIIDFYIKNKTFTLDDLNRRIRLFPFHELSKKPPPITPNICYLIETLLFLKLRVWILIYIFVYL